MSPPRKKISAKEEKKKVTLANKSLKQKQRRYVNQYARTNPQDKLLENITLPQQLTYPQKCTGKGRISDERNAELQTKSDTPTISQRDLLVSNVTENENFVQLNTAGCSKYLHDKYRKSIGNICSERNETRKVDRNDEMKKHEKLTLIIQMGQDVCNWENVTHEKYDCDEIPDAKEDEEEYEEEDDENYQDYFDSDDEDSDVDGDGGSDSHGEDNCDGEAGEGNMFSLESKIQQLKTPVVVINNRISYLTILLDILVEAIRHLLTYEAIVSRLISMRRIFGGEYLPQNKESLWKLLSRDDKTATTRHYYCDICWLDLGNDTKPTVDCACGKYGPGKINKKMCYFIVLNIEAQLRQIFSDASIVESLLYRFSRRKQKEDAVEDIYDGHKYKTLNRPGGFLSNKYNFSFGFFTDSCSAAKSSNVSAWPVMLTINELPPQARKKWIILAGIWVGTGHPNANTILLPIVKELNKLYDIGMKWTHPTDNVELTSKFVMVICTADTVARPMILNMTQFNGKHGCTYCYHEGESRDARSNARVYPNEYQQIRRKDKDIRRDMLLATNGIKQNGVKGASALICLKGFNLSSGLPVDTMHNVYLGVTRFHTSLFLDGPAVENYYYGNPTNLRKITEYLMKIRPPSKISRSPRPIQDCKNWKASEWRNWIQFGALPSLEGIISDVHHKHLALLSNAVYILNKSSITDDEMSEAKQSLTSYIQEFEILFGRQKMRYNVHLLSHVIYSVRNWGPFWTHSAFPYESWNKRIIDKLTSANSRLLQIVTRYLLTRYIESMMNNRRIDMTTKLHMNRQLTRGLKKHQYVIDATPSVQTSFEPRKLIDTREPVDSEIEAFRLTLYAPPVQVLFYKEAIINGNINCKRKDTNKNPRFCNEYIYSEDIGYVRIIDIITFRSVENMVVSGFLVQKLEIQCNAFHTSHIQYVTESTKVFLAVTENVPSLIVPAIRLGPDTDKGFLISKLANLNETD